MGVLLVILAAAYMLKIAFDKGWVPPAVRVAGGVVGGLGVAALGWRLAERRGLWTYGAALIGCGFGIIYLSIWAASRLYDLLLPGYDIAALTLVSFALAAVAFIMDIQALGSAAALGAFLAPIVVSTQGNPNNFLAYLALVGATLGGAAAAKHWRVTTFLVALSVFGLGLGAGLDSRADPWRVLLYGLFAGCAGLYVSLSERWPETRFLAFSGGWGLLAAASVSIPAPWSIALGGVVLAAPLWRAATSTTIWPSLAAIRPGQETDDADFPTLSAETLYFYATPFLVAWAVSHLSPSWEPTSPAVLLIIALPYAAMGFTKPLPPFAVVGTTAAVFAAVGQWSGQPRVWALMTLAFLWHGLDHWLHRPDGRTYGRFALAVATVSVFAVQPPLAPIIWFTLAATLAWAALDHALDRWDGRWNSLLPLAVTVLYLAWWREYRPSEALAFVDAWAVCLWLTIATTTALAVGLWRCEPLVGEGPRGIGEIEGAAAVPGFLWTGVGALLFVGVTLELQRFFRAFGSGDLASGLAVSAWWAVFAAGLVGLGFLQSNKAVRLAGLGVAGLAVAKVLLFDLSQLEAFYRVASVFILGVVTLGLAYLYHLQARGRTKS